MKLEWLAVATALGIFYAWRGGWFARTARPDAQRAAAARGFIWCVSLAIVAVPLQYFRQQLGDVLYVSVCAVVLVAAFALGEFVARRITGHDRENR